MKGDRISRKHLDVKLRIKFTSFSPSVSHKKIIHSTYMGIDIDTVSIHLNTILSFIHFDNKNIVLCLGEHTNHKPA